MPEQPADPQTVAATDLGARVQELERERAHLVALVEILQEISGNLNAVDILQAITRRLGDTFGLDRCSIFLAERGGRTARLVASYEDPGIRNYLVDLERYPEIRRALQSGETVFIPDAQRDARLAHVRGALAHRKVRTITVVPITWRRVAIGAIFLRTFRDGPAFSEADVEFTRAVGLVAAKALRVVHRYERLMRRQGEQAETARRAERERVALLEFLRRLMSAVTDRHGRQHEELLGRAAEDEIERLVDLTMAVLAEEGKGR